MFATAPLSGDSEVQLEAAEAVTLDPCTNTVAVPPTAVVFTGPATIDSSKSVAEPLALAAPLTVDAPPLISNCASARIFSTPIGVAMVLHHPLVYACAVRWTKNASGCTHVTS